MMKKLFIVLLTSYLSLIALKAQSLKLNQGDEFTYRTSAFSKKELQNTKEDTYSFSESFASHQIHFKVIEVLPNQFKLTAKYETIQQYNRTKNGTDKQWRSGNNYNKSLKNQYTTLQFPGFEVEYLLNKKGTIVNASVSNNKTKKNITDSLLIRRVEFAIEGLFYAFPKKIKKGQSIEIKKQKYTVFEIHNNQVTLHSISQENTPEYLCIYDTNKGLLLERNRFEDSHGKDKRVIKHISSLEKKDITFKANEIALTRTNLIVKNNTPFKCKFSKNGYEIDTIFASTNVTIRGKIKNPKGDGTVAIHYNERLPSEFCRYIIRSKIKEDNTFELRLMIDKPQKVTFKQHGVSHIYLSPGDDVYIEVDVEAFDETITSTGIGSNNLNHSFKKFLFEEKEKLGTGTMRHNIQHKSLELSPSAYKEYYMGILDDRQNYLNNNRKWLLPEQYLAEFYETQTTIADIISDYPKNQKKYRKKANKEPFTIDKRVFFDTDFYSLIHPDNDMMAFYKGYDRFIREYVFFFLDDQFEEITGKGNIITVNNYFDILYKSRYGFSNSFFSGISQHVLKYTSVCDALKRANWTVFVDLYTQFKKEYPNAYKTKLLTEAFHKAQKVAKGQPAFNFELSDFEGNKVKLSDFRGKVVYINFGSTYWSPYQGSVNKYSEKMQEAFKNTDIVMLYIASEDDVERPNKFVQAQNIKRVQLITKGKEESLIREKYFFNSIPHYYIIDKEGRIFKRNAPAPYKIVNDHSILLNALEPQ